MDVVEDRGIKLALIDAGRELAPNALVAEIDVVRMNETGIGGLVRPHVRDGFREDPKHTAHPLEICERRRFPGERIEQIGMERIACFKRRLSFRSLIARIKPHRYRQKNRRGSRF